jgi:hypothetical protein
MLGSLTPSHITDATAGGTQQLTPAMHQQSLKLLD